MCCHLKERAEMCATSASCIGTTNQAALQCYKKIQKNRNTKIQNIFANAASCICPNRQHIIAKLDRQTFWCRMLKNLVNYEIQMGNFPFSYVTNFYSSTGIWHGTLTAVIEVWCLLRGEVGNVHLPELVKVDDGQDDLDRLGDGGRHLHQPHVHGPGLRAPLLR